MPTQLVAYRTEAGIERIGARTADGVVHALDGDRNRLPEIVQAWTSAPDLGSDYPVETGGIQLIAPVSARSRVFCVAQNYPAHAAEAGGDSPEVPIIFLKPQAAFVGGSEAIVIPGVTQALDYEGEVGVVIGKRGRAATEDDAWGLIGGYTLGNDGSARDLQPATLAGRFQVDWFSAKSIDRSSALGPGLVHACTFEAPPHNRLPAPAQWRDRPAGRHGIDVSLDPVACCLHQPPGGTPPGRHHPHRNAGRRGEGPRPLSGVRRCRRDRRRPSWHAAEPLYDGVTLDTLREEADSINGTLSR